MKISLSLLLIGFYALSITGCKDNLLTNKSSSTVEGGFDNDTIVLGPAPTITGLSIVSTDDDTDTWYEVSDTITIAVTFSEAVTVDTTGGTPSIPVTLTSGTKNATYASGSGTSTLNFDLLIAASDEQCNGTLSLGGLSLNLATIKSLAGQNSENTGLASSIGGAKIDAVLPSVSSLSITTNNSFDDRSATISWTKSDGCGATTVRKSIGTHNGTICNAPTAVSGHQNIGDVNTFQAMSSVAPFGSFSIGDGTGHCSSVIAVDQAGNESTSAETALWSYYKSCKSHLAADPAAATGAYTIYNDIAVGPFSVYCDMTTQGGGWTLAIRYDKNNATAGAFNLPVGSGKTNINIADMSNITASANFTGSIDMAPLISAGATHIMHVGTASGSATYDNTYFSEIYQVVIDNPDNIFDLSFDTSNPEPVSGVYAAWSAVLKNRWFESDFSVMTNSATSGAQSNGAINGGEGQGMWTNGSREAALYSSGVASGGLVTGHGNPKVQWGFIGSAGLQQTYGGTIRVGTYCRNNLIACVPPSRMNLMFVR